MTVSAARLRNIFQTAYPNDYFYVCKFTAPGGSSSYEGQILLNVQLGDQDWLRVYKLSKSSGLPVNTDDIKRKAFPFVFDTKGITNNEKRRDRIRNSLRSVFPHHHIHVIIYNDAWESASSAKGSASFMNEYGSDVCVILS
ncbi:unnamed protein product [Rotaria sordida]|uniref:Uncharacterized protein n=1 Tax=Rotaria sordida TaxID=392033 RepID=A0A818Y145_9BILA|nr:unnamed protein product [Rotaria sordida]CAF1077250.1 unnamed protein product [Rotaria sordida]CAF1079348.1 unnamed protein product [Rotaria sordida]CAF1265850.1 unnamed protein product [Rotaria sordida]CAF3743904.1 unnamed protein product [Rotaria sordida]